MKILEQPSASQDPLAGFGPPEPDQPPTQKQIDTLDMLLVITIWSFAVSGLFRLGHIAYVFRKAYTNKVKEWYTFWMPLVIALYTITACLFSVYLYSIQRGYHWPELVIKGLFSGIFGFGSLHRWLQTFQYLSVCLSIPQVVRSITIDRYLKQGNEENDSQAARVSEDGPFDFNNYMEAIKQHRKKKECQESILKVTNIVMLSMIGLTTIGGLFDVFLPIFTFLVVISVTFVMCILLLFVINKQLKTIVAMLPNRGSITILIFSCCLTLIQWTTLSYAQLKVLLLSEQGFDVFNWHEFADAQVAYYITVYLLVFNVANVLCCINCYFIMKEIAGFIESKSNETEQSRSGSVQQIQSAFYFQEANKLQESIKNTMDESQRMKKEKRLKEQMNNFFQAVLKEVNQEENPRQQYQCSQYFKESGLIQAGQESDLVACDDECLIDGENEEQYDSDEHEEESEQNEERAVSIDHSTRDSMLVQDIFNQYVSQLAQEYPQFGYNKQNQSPLSPSVNRVHR